MAVDGGAGNAISFSEVQAFYGGSNPISISEYNRGGSLVPTSFAGASTATTANGAGTKNDFGITQTSQTVYTGSLQQQANSTSIPIQSDTAYIQIFNSHPDADGGQSTRTVQVFRNGTSIGTFSTTDGTGNGATLLACTIAGPANNGAVSSPNATYSSGTITFSGSSSFMREVTRAANTLYDITFTNNNSTGDTYTLAASSTGYSTKSSYAAGDSQKVKDDSSSNQWTIAYANVSGSGSGTAGDIGVTVTSQTDTRTTSTGFVSGQNSVCTLTVPSHSGLSFVSATGAVSEPNNDGNSHTTLKLNGTTVATGSAQEATGSSATYTGSASPGDTFQVLGGQSGRSLSITFTTPSRSIVFQNNGSSSQTLGSSTTPGGARTIAAGASSTAQSAGSAGGFNNNQSWQVYFDTSSGNCNTNIPTTIGSGNSVNLDLFNAPGTPVG